MCNQCAKFEWWGMKTVGVSDYANLVSPSGTVPRPTFGGGDAGNKHLEVTTWSSNQQGVYFNCG